MSAFRAVARRQCSSLSSKASSKAFVPPPRAAPLCCSYHHAAKSLTGTARQPHRPALEHLSKTKPTAPHPRHASTAQPEPRRTPLYDLHVQNGATMVPFGGYNMPVQYDDQSIWESHIWTRRSASIFDVSHMVQHQLSGPGAQGLLESLTPAGLGSLQNNHSTLSALLLPQTGGIVDDTVITRLGPQSFYLVTNAGRREADIAFLQSNIEAWQAAGKGAVEWAVLEGQGLVALQGPKAHEVLERALVEHTAEDLKAMYFGQCRFVSVKLGGGKQSAPLLVSRGGYTGEDGFEISVPEGETAAFVEFLLADSGEGVVRLAGLGARDSLRLEAGMCLYGHDLDEQTTPVEGGLSWIVAKERRQNGDFNGAEVVLRQLKPKSEGGSGTTKRRVGFTIEGAPAREGAELVDAEGNAVGKITSGCPSPTVGKNIAMGYVKTGYNKAGTELFALVRGKKRKATVTKMPFVPSKYWKGGASPG